jgi:1-deoxy-D-xylulose-5-phosphate reductoisomerase
MPTVANAANEAALQLFLESKIRFVDIAGIVQTALDQAEYIGSPDLDTIIAINKATYRQVLSH